MTVDHRARDVQPYSPVSTVELAADLHGAHRRIRSRGPVVWVEGYQGWLVTSRALAVEVLRDATTFTVDDPRFATARVVGPSMLSLDGPEHTRHRRPFLDALRSQGTRAAVESSARHHARTLVAGFAGAGSVEVRRGLAGPLAVAVMADLLDLAAEPAELLGWYDQIVAATVTASLGGAATGAEQAMAELEARVVRCMARPGGFLSQMAGQLTVAEVVSNTAVLLFGGIETVEAMICNLLVDLFDTGLWAEVRDDPALAATAIEESLRHEPGAAQLDRYATCDVELAGAGIRSGDFVVVSLAGANRDPHVYPEPDRFDPRRIDPVPHLAFAQGPHTCIGIHQAKAEAHAAIEAMAALEGLTPDPASPPPRIEGVVFRKPPELHVAWST